MSKQKKGASSYEKNPYKKTTNGNEKTTTRNLRQQTIKRNAYKEHEGSNTPQYKRNKQHILPTEGYIYKKNRNKQQGRTK